MARVPWLLPACCALFFFAEAGTARADLARATAYFQKGTRLYEVGEYAQAIEQFKAAHVEEPDPSFIYNIAQCHRQLGHSKEALTSFKRFLALDPDTPMRADVERKVAELEAVVRRQAPESPVISASPPVNAAPTPADRAEPVAQRAPPARRIEARSRWPLWVGGALTLVLAGGATALALKTNADFDRLNRRCGRGSGEAPACPSGEVDSIKTRETMVNVLFVAAGVSALATGVGLYLTSRETTVSLSFAF